MSRTRDHKKCDILYPWRGRHIYSSHDTIPHNNFHLPVMIPCKPYATSEYSEVADCQTTVNALDSDEGRKRFLC